jgi:predicted RNA-binding Zn-ribbon protein involved in translation (DUF1610 family)
MSNRCPCGAIWRCSKNKAKGTTIFLVEHHDKCGFNKKNKGNKKR